MTNEQMQKAMEFIVETQAQTTVKLDRLSAKVDGLTDSVGALAAVQERSEKKWERTEAGIRALLSIAEIHEREIATLTENTRSTDERLNILINTVERNISEGRNGKP